MPSSADAVEEKLCGACLQELSADNFSKKQWQQKQRRRCKGCTDSGKDVDVAKLNAIINKGGEQVPSNASSSTKKKKGKKNKQPIFAGNTDGRYQKNDGPKLAYNICAWCGKTEEQVKLMTCSGCENIYYCSRVCQKAAHPEHKLVCGKLKEDRKNTKKERKVSKKGNFSISEASGTGSFFLEYHPGPGGFSFLSYTGELRGGEEPGQFFATDAAEEGAKRLLGQKFPLFCSTLREESLKLAGTLKRVEMFTNVDELHAIDQFLLACGPLNDIQRAKEALPYVLHQINISGLKPDGSIADIGDITVRGYSLNALEWASRRGNFEIAEWLATDSRTKVMLSRSDSAPVAWACYTNRVELARMLVKRGTDSHATYSSVFDHKPPSHLAGENGQLLAVKFLIEECGHDIHECDNDGQDIRVSLRRNNKVWASSAGCVAVDDYAKSKGVLGEMSATNKKAKAARRKKTEQSLDHKLAAALRQLEIAGGREDDDNGSDDDEADPGDYLNELLAVADARYDLGQFSKSASIYYKGYHVAMHKGSCINDPAIFPIAHKMIQSFAKAGEESDLKWAHGMAQQNVNMPGHPAYIREDLKEVERIMTKKGMNVERF